MNEKHALKFFPLLLLALAMWAHADDNDTDDGKKNREAARALATLLCDKPDDLVEAHCGQTASDCEQTTLYVDVDVDCPLTVVLAEPDVIDGEPIAVPRWNQAVEVLGCKCGVGTNFYLVKAPNFCGFIRTIALRSEKHPPYKANKPLKSAAGVEACTGAAKG